MWELTKVIDQVIDTSREPAPQQMVHAVLMRLDNDARESAFREALRAYIELRIYERQDEPQLVSPDHSGTDVAE